jgi:NTE family protein
MGLFGEQKRRAMLRQLLGERSFEQLNIPCAVVAADLVRGEEVVIGEGPLVPALLATTAIPGVFPPVARGKQLLADGGLFNNVPADVALRLGAQRVITVELTGVATDFTMPSAVPANPLARLTLAPRQFAIASRALALLMDQATESRLAHNPPALRLRPDVSALPTLDMSNPQAGYAIGVAAARAAAAELLALRDWRAGIDAGRLEKR